MREIAPRVAPRGRRGAVSLIVRALLLVSGLQELHQTILAHRLQHPDGGSRLGADAGDVASEEEPDAGCGSELTNAPGAAGVIGDAPDDDAPQSLSAGVSRTHDAEGRTYAGIQDSSGPHERFSSAVWLEDRCRASGASDQAVPDA